MAFMGADTDQLREAAQECQEGKEATDEVITYLRVLIALLRAASFFTGGASAAYADYLESTVVPWLQRISQALGLFAQVLGGHAEAQDQASAGESVDWAALPSYSTPALPTPSPQSGVELGGNSQTADLLALVGLGGLAGMFDQPAGQGAAGPSVSPAGAPTGAATAAASDGSTGATSPVPCATTTLGDERLRHDGTTGAETFARGGVPSAGELGAGGGAGGSGAAGGALGGGVPSGGSQGATGASPDGSSTGLGPSSGDPVTHSTGGIPSGTPEEGAAGGARGPDLVSSEDAGTAYGAAGAIGGGAAALGLGGAALAARAAASGGADPEIDRLAAANGRGSRGEDVRALQQRLSDAGYDTRGVDGAWGANTQAAYDAYRADHPLEVRHGAGYTSPDGFNYNQISGVRGNNNVTPEFLRGVEGVAQRIGARPEHLMAVMSFETGGQFGADTPTRAGSAIGLIQFTPVARADLGVSREQLAAMTPTEQLTYVERYFDRRRGNLDTVEGLYSAVLGGSSREADDVLFRRGDRGYGPNSGLDRAPRDGQVTVAEAAERVRRALAGR